MCYNNTSKIRLEIKSKNYKIVFPKIVLWLSRPVIIAIAAVAIVTSVFFVVSRNGNGKAITQVVNRGDLTQRVSASGIVKSAEEVDLAFEISGKVGKVLARVGDEVLAGQTLVELIRGDELAARAKAVAGLESAKATLLQYEAALDVAEAELAEIQRGTREEELTVKRAELEAAKLDLQNAYKDIKTLLLEKYAKADDAVRKQTDEMFTNDNLASPSLSFTTTNFQAELDAESLRRSSELALQDWLFEINSLSINFSEEELETALSNALAHLQLIRNFLDTTADALDQAVSISQTTITSYKASLNTGRANVTAAITAVANQQQTIMSEKIAMATSESELALLEAGNTEEAVIAQLARVKQAEANVAQQRALIMQSQAGVQAADSDLSKNILVAPITGVVTEQNAKVGQIVAANSNMVSLISDSEFEIEVDISEVDISKFKIGDPANVTLDAYGKDTVLAATVVSVEPAERVIAGIPSYRTKLILVSNGVEFRSGMTANIEISSIEAEDVLLVPRRSLIIENEKEFVRVVKNNGINKIEMIKVMTGRTDSEGNIEIISGLNGGETIIVAEKQD